MFLLLLKYATVASMVAAILAQFTYRFKQSRERSSRHEVVRGTLCVFLVAVSFVSICTGWLECRDIWSIIIGQIIILLAAGLRIWAQVVLGRNWSVGVKIQEDHRLVTSGPYRPFRHPMYASYGMMGAAMIILTQNVVVFLGWAFFWILLFERALEESSALDRRFPGYEQWATDGDKIAPTIYLRLKAIFRG